MRALLVLLILSLNSIIGIMAKPLGILLSFSSGDRSSTKLRFEENLLSVTIQECHNLVKQLLIQYKDKEQGEQGEFGIEEEDDFRLEFYDRDLQVS